jgi:Tfp pilus assembly protein PilE
MAKAGYCSECGENMWLDADGGCEAGHGPECITDVYDAPDGEDLQAGVPGSGPAPEPSPTAPEAPAEPAAPVVPQAVTSVGGGQPPSPKRRSGLVAAAVVIVLLLVVAIGGAVVIPAMMKAKSSSQGATVKAKVTAAMSFMEAFLNNDTDGIKPYLLSSAQVSLTATQWAKVRSAITSGGVVYAAPVWSHDTTALVSFKNGDTTGTLTFAPDPKATGTVTMDGESAKGNEVDTIKVKTESGSWKVVSISDGNGNNITLDAAFVKNVFTSLK